MKAPHGVLTAIATPFDRHGELALDLVPGLLELQSRAGMSGVVVAGTNGEGPSLSVEERIRLLETVVANRRDLVVVAGTGAASVTDAVRLARHACEAGADALLVLPPFFFKGVTTDGLAAYFERVLEASSVPVLLYSIPQVSAIAISHELLDRLAAHPRLLGLKDSSGDWEGMRGFLERGDVQVFAGSDDLLARAFRAGAAGAISGTANAAPELVAAVWNAWRDGGDLDAAQERLDAARRVLIRYPMLAANKSVLAHRGLGRMSVRPPLVDLSPEAEAELLAQLAPVAGWSADGG